MEAVHSAHVALHTMTFTYIYKTELIHQLQTYLSVRSFNTPTCFGTFIPSLENNKLYCTNFTSMLPCCIVIDFILNNQPDAVIIQIYSVIKLHVSGIFCAHHQEFSTVHSALVSYMQVFDDRFQADSGWNCSSILTLLGNVHHNLHETYQYRMYSRRLLMMGKEVARNM